MPTLRSARAALAGVPGSQKLMVAPMLALLAFVAPPGASGGMRPVDGRTPGAATTVAGATALACANEVAGKLPIQQALRHYIKQAKPRPMRFLIAAGTDSALSESAAKVLQEFGPMYYYGGTEAAKQKVRERLEIVGPFPALLIVKRTSAKPTSATEIIRLGGHYVTGENDGQKTESSQYTFVCGASGWVMQGVKAEGSA